jgi:amidase
MELWRLTAREAVALLRRREVSPLELVDAAAARIEAVEPAVNALPTLCLDRARERAKALRVPSELVPGHLYGLPIVVKDLNAVAGVRWTDGSRVFADRVPERSDIMVEILEANGAIVIAKSNTPEFGAGGTTVNDVFGSTLNPWDTRYTCGGSSGGSAVALATGEAWLATGNDLGGSLRLPASFCSVVGLRPSPGRVAHGPEKLPFSTLNVDGPMARNVGDLALMLDAMAGQHPEDPISLTRPARPFLDAVTAPTKPRRIAWSPDLGIAPVHREVRAICAKAMAVFEQLGVEVEQAHPDMSDADATFQILRSVQRAGGTADLLRDHREKLSKEVVFYAEKALGLTAREIVEAERARGALFARIARFFQRYDLLVTPTVMVPPFDAARRHVMEVEGQKFTDYFTWLRLTFTITATSCPAISVPCGFTADGLPVGIQIIAPSRGEAALLSAAALFEAAQPIAAMVPIDPRGNARASGITPRAESSAGSKVA